MAKIIVPYVVCQQNQLSKLLFDTVSFATTVNRLFLTRHIYILKTLHCAHIVR